MNEGLAGTIAVILFLQAFIFIWTWVEKRLKPMMVKFHIIEDDVFKLHEIGNKYASMGLCVPEEILTEPSSQVLTHVRRIETRMIFELISIVLASLIPPLAILIQ